MEPRDLSDNVVDGWKYMLVMFYLFYLAVNERDFIRNCLAINKENSVEGGELLKFLLL